MVTTDVIAETGQAACRQLYPSALYAGHALGLTRLAQVMPGDRPAAEDMVHGWFSSITGTEGSQIPAIASW